MEQFKKLTEDEIFDALERGEKEKLLNSLPDSVKNHLVYAEERFGDQFVFCLAECESPIEQMMSISLESRFMHGKMDIPLLVDVIGIEKQSKIFCGDREYRVDFTIPVAYWNCLKVFVVECDGHEFHQKTKEQVERDNRRMRDLQKEGYCVIRFSGTEIYHMADRCACEVQNIIQAPAIEFIREAISHGGKQSQ